MTAEQQTEVIVRSAIEKMLSYKPTEKTLASAAFTVTLRVCSGILEQTEDPHDRELNRIVFEKCCLDVREALEVSDATRH